VGTIRLRLTTFSTSALTLVTVTRAIESLTAIALPSAQELERRKATTTELNLVGKIDGYSVYDLDYAFTGHAYLRGMKSVLIESAPNQFHEIYVRALDNMQGQGEWPTEIIDDGQQSILKMKFEDGGNYVIVYEDYFVIVNGIPVLLDFDPVLKAAKEVVPKGMTAYQPTSEYHFGSHVFSIRTERTDADVGPKVAGCEGRVEVHFSIENGSVIAGQATYSPD
jgi:hypothetical protein